MFWLGLLAVEVLLLWFTYERARRTKSDWAIAGFYLVVIGCVIADLIAGVVAIVVWLCRLRW